jgi:hypothetical protein
MERGTMDHRVRAQEGGREQVAVSDIADVVDGRGSQAIDTHHLVLMAGGETNADSASDTAGAAGNDDSHGSSPRGSSCRAVAPFGIFLVGGFVMAALMLIAFMMRMEPGRGAGDRLS